MYCESHFVVVLKHHSNDYLESDRGYGGIKEAAGPKRVENFNPTPAAV